MKRGTRRERNAAGCWNTRRLRFGNQMTRSTSADDRHEPNSTDPRPRTIFLGIDADGSHHLYATRTETVFVVENGVRVWREADVDVDAWVAHITDRRGWDVKRYGPLGEMVARAWETAQREEAV